MTEYLSKEDIAIAKSNGISYGNAYSRIYNLGWEKERAITTPLNVKRRDALWTQWKHIAIPNGIKDSTFLNRIRFQGMTPEQAATRPKMSRSEIALKANAKRVYSSRIDKEIRKRAKKNGISYERLCQRVYRLKWDIERACTEPVKQNES